MNDNLSHTLLKMSAIGPIEIECAACGLSLGVGLPGSRYFCLKCGDFVLSKTKAGNYGVAVGAVILIGLFVLIGAAFAKALRD